MREPILLSVYTFNAMPATQRKTVNGVRYVLMGCGEWREVQIIRPAMRSAAQAVASVFFLAMGLWGLGSPAPGQPAAVVEICPVDCPCGCAVTGECRCGLVFQDTLPNLGGECRWGTIVQVGRGVSIDGPSWQALGRIREDGLLELLWQYKATGMRAIGVYQVKDGEAIGHYGWENSAEVQSDGTLKGRIYPENLFN